ncbi:hypothetical protein JTB14_013830 [Gonioctena quinquepunctata]|nr:hypothetical protein JTB14_013830 [Gonioctena quinquepunctata]
MNIVRFSISGSYVRTAQIIVGQYKGLQTCAIRNLIQLRLNNKFQAKYVSTCEVKNLPKEDGILKKVLKKIPFLNIHKMRLKAASYILYEEIADKVDYVSFFEEFHLPDTFYSWFVVTELHIWMLSVRVMADGEDGLLIRNAIFDALWRDVTQRVKKLGTGNPSAVKQDIEELSEQLQAALIAYDEGIQSDDTVLAGALWRRLYQMGHVHPHNLEKLVEFVRKQMRRQPRL